MMCCRVYHTCGLSHVFVCVCVCVVCVVVLQLHSADLLHTKYVPSSVHYIVYGVHVLLMTNTRAS